MPLLQQKGRGIKKAADDAAANKHTRRTLGNADVFPDAIEARCNCKSGILYEALERLAGQACGRDCAERESRKNHIDRVWPRKRSAGACAPRIGFQFARTTGGGVHDPSVIAAFGQ